jgi:hypothetical protein
VSKLKRWFKFHFFPFFCLNLNCIHMFFLEVHKGYTEGSNYSLSFLWPCFCFPLMETQWIQYKHEIDHLFLFLSFFQLHRYVPHALSSSTTTPALEVQLCSAHLDLPLNPLSLCCLRFVSNKLLTPLSVGTCLSHVNDSRLRSMSHSTFVDSI